MARKLKMECWIILEFCDGGSLDSALDKGLFHPGGVPSMTNILHLCCQVAQGIRYLHEQQIYHGDLKAVNVLLMLADLDSRCEPVLLFSK